MFRKDRRQVVTVLEVNGKKHEIELIDGGEVFLTPIYDGVELTDYRISNYGRLYSLRKNRIMKKQYMKNYGYFYRLSYNGKLRQLAVHRIVAFTFVNNPRPAEFDCVKFIDGDKSNSRADNLKWTNRVPERHFSDDYALKFTDKSEGRYYEY